MPDTFATFAGQTRTVGGSYTVGWGTPAGVCRLATGIDFGEPGQVGDLIITYRGNSVTLRDALVCDPVASFDVSSAPLKQFTVKDRRWKWENDGYIDGDYNYEKKDGTLLRQASPRQLAEFCLIKLGEPAGGPRAFDVAALPATPRPRISWNAASPREELDRICADFGCVVCFDPIDDRVRIHKIGEGGNPPNMGFISRNDAQVIPAPLSGIRVIGGPVLFQSALRLGEAVGRDVDGVFYPIDQLSYKPAGGWSSIDPWDFAQLESTYTDPATGETLYHRDLAVGSVWRCYRINGQKAGGFSPQALIGSPRAPQSILDLGPFTGSLLDKDLATNERLPAYVRGLFADERLAFDNCKPNTRFPGSVTIDSEQRIVSFSKPLFKYNAAGQPEPADVELIAAYACSRDGVATRYEEFRTNNNANFGAQEQIEHHDEIVREIIEKTASASGAAKDNLTTVKAAADYYLDALVQRFVTVPATNAT